MTSTTHPASRVCSVSKLDLPIAEIVNAQVISFEEAPKGYADFDKGVPVKFILDPHGTVAKTA